MMRAMDEERNSPQRPQSALSEEGSAALDGPFEFRFGKNWGTPPIKNEEWESGWESVGCRSIDFGSAQALKNEWVSDGRGIPFEVFRSKRRREFTKECNMGKSTCQ
jgi:hypothetical protein